MPSLPVSFCHQYGENLISYTRDSNPEFFDYFYISSLSITYYKSFVDKISVTYKLFGENHSSSCNRFMRLTDSIHEGTNKVKYKCEYRLLKSMEQCLRDAELYFEPPKNARNI